MLRIAIINITGGGISGGYKEYLKNLLPFMSRHHNVEAILCASPQNLAVPSWVERLNNVTFVNCKPFNVFGKRDVDLQGRLDEFHPNVVFVPLERYFRYRHIPTVCMLQNMLPMVPIKHPNLLEIVRNQIQKAITVKAIKGSQRIIAISNFVSNFMQDKWQIPAHKISVVYHGVSLSVDKETMPASIAPRWKGKFIFTAGSIQPYRGLEDVFLALKRIRDNGYDVNVLVAGIPPPAMMSYYKKLQGLVDQLGLRENICWAGALNTEEMSWCYKNCRAFIMTSRVESFGMIAVEAMSHGCICISTENPCLPEIFEDAALYYPSQNIDALVKIIKDVLVGIQRKGKMVDRAKKRASEFSWEDTANKTVNEFKKAVSLAKVD